jgi:hypothetical protein
VEKDMIVGTLECKEPVQGSVMTVARELARYNLDLVGVCRWEDNIKMDFQEVGCEDMDWIDLAQESYKWRTLVNAVINIRVL